MTAPRALVFDVFGTLVDWRSTVAATFRECGVAADADELADDWRSRYWPILAEVNSGARPWGNFDECHHVTLDALLAERGLEAGAQARAALVRAWHRLDPWPDVRGGLEELRHRHVVATLSNGHVALLVDLARHGDLRFDCILAAELSGAYKPAREVYLTAARLLDFAPHEVMMVACHPWDLAGARAAGLRTAYVDRPREYGPMSPAREDPQAEESVSDLGELARRLIG